MQVVLSGIKDDRNDQDRGVLEKPDGNYAKVYDILDITDTIYYNPYEVVTFYDNHDIKRFQGLKDEANYLDGYIDANNFLFTARGIPCVYYGSETAFGCGMDEHEGNRNYYGQERIDKAKEGKIYKNLKIIAEIRKNNIALQKGLQINLKEQFKDNKAAFYRIYQSDGINQTVLVLLNKANNPQQFTIDKYLSSGEWFDLKKKELISIDSEKPELTINVEPHGVKVFVLNDKINNNDLIEICQKKMNK